MLLSKLQQYILEECLNRGGQCQRHIFDINCAIKHSHAQSENYKKIVTQSIERLIERGMVVGYGLKTREKLFIEKVKLTPTGKRAVYEFRAARQARLPLTKKHASNKN